MKTLAKRIVETTSEMHAMQDRLHDMVLTEVARGFLAQYPDAEAIEFQVIEEEPGWFIPEALTVIGGEADMHTDEYKDFSGVYEAWSYDQREEVATDLFRDEFLPFMWLDFANAEFVTHRIDLMEHAAKQYDTEEV